MNWKSLDKIGKIKALNITYIIFILLPILAKMFSNISNIEFVINNKEYNLVLNLPFSWITLYFSALFITLGNLLYHFNCPELIRKYDDYSTFKSGGRDGRYLKAQIENIAQNRKNATTNDIIEIIKTEYSECHHLSCGDMVYKMGDIPGMTGSNEDFWFVTDVLNYSKKRIRIITSIFYYIGILLFIIVSFQKMKYVVIYLYKIYFH